MLNRGNLDCFSHSVGDVPVGLVHDELDGVPAGLLLLVVGGGGGGRGEADRHHWAARSLF